MIGIYKITSPSNRIYIGQSTNISKRFHHYLKLQNCNGQIKLYNSFLKYGVDKHLFEIICECANIELNEKERYYQDLYSAVKNGLNLMLTKCDSKSGEMSNESKMKMRLTHLGEKNIMFGKTHTKEAREEISKTHLGRKLSDEHKIKIKQNHICHNRGIKMTQEQKNKISKTKTGIRMTEENKEKIRLASKKSKEVYDSKNLIIYDSCNQAAKELGINRNTLFYYLSGKRKNKTSLRWL